MMRQRRFTTRFLMGSACGLVAAVCFALGLRAAAASGDVDATRTVRFTYAVTVQDIPSDARELSIWIPIPKTDRHQEVRDLKVNSPVAYQILHDREYGNSILHLSADAPLPTRLDLQMEAVVERRAYNVLGGEHRADSDKPVDRDLEPNRLVPTDGLIADLARQATQGARTPLEKARAIYDYVTDTMRYDKTGEGWGRGDALYACDARKGNCTDFHSLIIGMARASDIPARFVMGFPLPENRKQGEIPGYHCWAEMYVEGIGWLPVDSSEASKQPEKREIFFGGLDANRVQITLGRDLELEPETLQPLNFFVYPYVEVDGQPHNAVTRNFSFVELGA